MRNVWSSASVAQELTLSFVPDAEQRLWRTVMRRKYQITRNRVQLHNRLESLLEEAHLKLSSLVSDLLGTSARRMLQVLADGETDPATVASLTDQRLRDTAAQLSDALSACTTLHPVYRRLLKLTLEELRLIEEHLGLDQQMANLLAAHHEAVRRLAEPGDLRRHRRSCRKPVPAPALSRVDDLSGHDVFVRRSSKVICLAERVSAFLVSHAFSRHLNKADNSALCRTVCVPRVPLTSH